MKCWDAEIVFVNGIGTIHTQIWSKTKRKALKQIRKNWKCAKHRIESMNILKEHGEN